MIFVKKLIELQRCFYNNFEIKKGALLYGIQSSPPPLATHILFQPMSIPTQTSLVSSYQREFPKELLELYSFTNGLCLFWSAQYIGMSGKKIPFNLLSVYGLPESFDHECIEPFSIKIEDLNRPKGVPSEWLKFGSYYESVDSLDRFDLFVDTNSHKVFAIIHRASDFRVERNWESIDACLCEIFDLLKESTGDKGTV